MSKTVTERVSLYEGSVVIDFYPNSHRYKLIGLEGEPSGEWIKSPSSIVNKLDKSQPLIHWAVNCFYDKVVEEMRDGHNFSRDDLMSMLELGKKAHTERKEAAADVGTVVHDYALGRIKGLGIEQVEGFSDLSEEDQDKARMGAQALDAWHESLGGETVASEFLVYSKKQNVVGRCDELLRVGNDLVIVDYKTSKGVYSSQVYQVAFYHKAREEETGEHIAGARLVHLIKDDILDKEGNVIKRAGEFGEVFLSRSDLVRAYKVFKALKVVADMDPQIEKLTRYY